MVVVNIHLLSQTINVVVQLLYFLSDACLVSTQNRIIHWFIIVRERVILLRVYCCWLLPCKGATRMSFRWVNVSYVLIKPLYWMLVVTVFKRFLLILNSTYILTTLVISVFITQYSKWLMLDVLVTLQIIGWLSITLSNSLIVLVELSVLFVVLCNTIVN